MDPKVLPTAENTFRSMMSRRWKYIVGRYTKLLRVRPLNVGGPSRAFIREAMVTVPSEIMDNISKIDLAMVVASGPDIIYHSVVRCDVSSYRPGQSIKNNPSCVFKVRVILNPDSVLEKRNISINGE